MRKNRFENAHITDLVKVRVTGREVDYMFSDVALMDKQRAYFLEEVDIIQPRLIAPMGKRTAEILRKWLSGDSRIRPIPHYSPRIPTKENFDKFSSAMRSLRAEYDRHA